jgi:hypothetical protein
MLDESEIDTFEDISFEIGINEGFCSSESVYDSDISETDSEADDCDDEEGSWLEIEGSDGFVTGVLWNGIDCLSEISFCTAKHKKNLSTTDIVQHYYTSDTESETDDDEDHDDEPFVVKPYMDLSTTIACDDLDLMYDASLCSCSESITLLSPASRQCSPSISGFDVYIAFYSIALVTFLALETLPIDLRGCTTHLCVPESRKGREPEALDLQ